MPYLVNGQIVTERLIREELERLSRDPNLNQIADEAERLRSLRRAAEVSAADRVLIEQLAMNDPRGVDAAAVEEQIERLRAQGGFGSGVPDTLMRQRVERHLRTQRFQKELLGDAPKPTAEEVEAFYLENAPNFKQPELFRAAHIVKYVRRGDDPEHALAALKQALGELEEGEAFGDVARRHSDCRDAGGDLGQFPAGHMVEEFEQAIRSIEPGERTGIFQTPFGFHIAVLKERTEPGIASLERVQAEIERVMAYARQHEVYLRKMDEIRSQADIQWVV